MNVKVLNGFYLCLAVWACLATVSLARLYKYHIHNTDISISASRVSLLLTVGEHKIGVKWPRDSGEPEECGDDRICIGWSDGSGPTMTLSPVKYSHNDITMWNFRLHDADGAVVYLILDGTLLYGGPVGFEWPANLNSLSNTPYVTGFNGSIAVAEKYWFTSTGLALNVDMDDHLFVTQDSKSLRLEFGQGVPYSSNDPSVKIRMCFGKDAKEAFSCFPQERRRTDAKMIKDPIWSTWVRYKANISQEKVMDFADDIKKNGFTISTMEIDDKWETCYGNHQWDRTKFPDPAAMVRQLKSRGMYVTLWVHPFVNIECPFFDEAQPYLYKLPNGSVGVTDWWNGRAGLIDFTNPKAREWFKRRLTALKNDVGLTGFKFDAGEAKYIPGVLNGITRLSVPNQFTHEYVKMASHFGNVGEVRVGSDNAETPMFQRLQDTDTHWEASKGGLRSVIPAVLTLNSLGYPAVIPDMVGGNLYTGPITKELFIRWLQLNTFLPVIQFSIAPWDFDNETVEICRRYTQLHSDVISNIITREIEKGDFTDGHRVISPAWWLSPNDSRALTEQTEFLVGTNILVAPVVEEGATKRDVYLPAGSWLDATSGQVHKGPVLLSDYPAPLSVLPYFTRTQ